MLSVVVALINVAGSDNHPQHNKRQARPRWCSFKESDAGSVVASRKEQALEEMRRRQRSLHLTPEVQCPSVLKAVLRTMMEMEDG